MLRRNVIGSLCALVILAPVSPAGAAWVVTEVPQQAGWSGDTKLYGVNDSGVACGTGDYVSGTSSLAFRFDGTTVTELPYLHPSPVTTPFGWGSAINGSGVVAGWSHNAAGTDRAVFWTGTTITEVPVPADINTSGVDPGDDDMRAYGINDAGVVVGYYKRDDGTENGVPTAFYYDGTTYSLRSALVTAGLTGRSYAEDANSSGLICGHAEDASADYNFYTYDIGTGTVTVLGKYIAAQDYFTSAINDAGEVVGRGRSTIVSPIHALLHDGAFNIIDDTITVAQWSKDITNAGRVVGYADTSTNQWAWYSDAPGSNSMQQVDLPDWTRESFWGVNSSDVMAGYGVTTTSGTIRAGSLSLRRRATRITTGTSIWTIIWSSRRA